MSNYVINPEQTVGQFLPNVYISQITLRSDTGYSLNEINPHIDYPGEGTQIRGDGSLQVELAITVKDVLGPGNISQWFSAGTLPNNTSLKQFVNINIVQTQTKEATARWSMNMAQPDKLYAGSRIDPGNGASVYVMSLNDFDNGESLERHISEFDNQGNSVKNISTTITSDDRAWKPGVPGSKLGVPPKPTDLAYFVWASFDILGLADVFELQGSKLIDASNHHAPLNGKLNSDVVFKNGKLVKNGYVFFEAIRLSNGKLQKTDRIWNGRVHYHKNGPGGYEGYMGGQFHDGNATRAQQPYLFRQTVANNKIQDFRIVNRLDKLELNFSNLQNDLLRALNTERRSIIEDTKFSYFTELMMSRDRDNNCRFLFGLDLRKLVRENSPYSTIFTVADNKNPRWLQEAMKKVQILSMKVYRKRTVGSSEVGTSPYYYPGDHHFEPVPKLDKFDNALLRNHRNGTSYDPSEELLIDASEVETAPGFKFIGDGAASMDGRSTMRQINGIFNNSTRAINFYTGTDAGMSTLTDGYYQYKIEIEVRDSVVDFLIEKRATLMEQLKKLKQYYNEGTKTGNKFASGKVQEAYYNPTTNRFTQAFIDYATSWPKDAPSKYIDTLKIFSNLSDDDTRDYTRVLTSYVNPSTGNPQGCLALMNLYDNLVSFINRAIGIQKEKPFEAPKDNDPMNAAGTSNNVFETDVGSAGRPYVKTFKIEHTFSEYYDGNLPQNVGYDFLGAGYNIGLTDTPSKTGLRVIPSDVFKDEIVRKELLKIFNDTSSRIDMHGIATKTFGSEHISPSNNLQETDFSFLTPSVVYSSDSTLAMIGQNTDAAPNINTRQFMNMTMGNVQNATNTLISTNSLEEKTADFLSYNYNLTAIPSPEPRTSINPPGTNTDNVPSSTPNEDYEQLSNAQASQNIQAFQVFWDLISNGVVSDGNRAGVQLPEGTNQKSVKYYSSEEVNGFWDAFVDSIPANLPDRTAKITSAINQLPNAIKALIRYNDETVALTFNRNYGEGALKTPIDSFLQSEPFASPNLASRARILFETINEIQYLDAYGMTEYAIGDEKIEEHTTAIPVWKTLNRNIFNQIGNIDPSKGPKALICRMRSWESDTFKTQRHPANDLPTYEKYFILNTSPTDLPRDNERPEEPIFSAETPDTPENIIGNPDSTDSSDPWVDYVATNWDADDIISNLTPAPPPDLAGNPVADVDPGRPSGDSPPPQPGMNPYGPAPGNPLTSEMQTQTGNSSGENASGEMSGGPMRGGNIVGGGGYNA